MNEGGDGWSEGLQLIRADPNQKPAVILDTGRESGAETGASANANASFVDSRCV